MDFASPIRVFIVDDHQLIVDGIRSLVSASDSIVISGSTNDSQEVLPMLSLYPSDILICDISMPGLSGVELTRKVRKDFPDMKVIALSMYGDKAAISQMLQAGISGYVLKNTGKHELITAIQQVYSGKTFFSEDVTSEIMKSMTQSDDTPRLTNREIEIIRLIEKELSNKQIADKLFISERTVETHRKNIFRKTSTQSIVGLVKYAYDHKLI